MYFTFAKSTSIKDEDLEGTDKIRTQYVRREYTKDTIVLLPEEKADSCQRDSKCWRMLCACTYIVIDDKVTSIGNAFDRGIASIG